MPLVKRDGQYWTPGGCSAWNGKCFTGAAVNTKCGGAAIAFAHGGWYVHRTMTYPFMHDWFYHKEDPGCAWNGSSQSFRDGWKAVDDPTFRTLTWDVFWNPVSLEFENTYVRPPEDWFEPCDDWPDELP